MYKGNMGDFVEKVNDYISTHYNSKIIFGSISLDDGRGYFVAFFGPGQGAALGYRVYDQQNFEQQIYDYVNEQLEYVQGKYNGFPEQPKSLFGENVSGTEDEDNLSSTTSENI